jgi:spore coat polysaccharide biosynthesis protein SpsF
MIVDATVQARLGSRRLPGKVLAPILGRPLIEYQIERIRRSNIINRVVIATTTNPQDDAIVALAQRLGCECFRGSEDDVIGRVLGSLRQFEIEVNAEFQGDNSIPDPQIIDRVLGYYLDHCDEFDYVTNSLKTTYPPGLEVSVYRRSVLADAEARIVEPLLREHVGIHIYQHPELYRVKNLEAPPELVRPNLHLEVDTQEDLELVSAIYEHFMPTNPEFSLADVIAFTDANPHLTQRNENVERRWKQYRNEG